MRRTLIMGVGASKVKARFGKQEAESSDPDDIVLLKEIRDLLASRQGGAV